MRKKKNNLTILIILFVIFVIAAGIVSFLLYKSKSNEKKYLAQITDLKQTIASNKQFVYVATDDLSKGTILEENVNVELQEIVTALPAELYMQEEDLGKMLTVDVTAYEPIGSSMLTEEAITKDSRDYEIGVANLMVDQQVNDFVDVRIMFPDGRDYIVLSKLKVKNLLLENSIFYANLNESEILTLASATIDAYTISGTKIYLTRYVESNLQEDAIPNYPVRTDIIDLIATDPNVLEIAQNTLNYSARQEMEQKLATLSEEHLKSVVAGHGIVDTANSTAMTTRITEQETLVDENTTGETTEEGNLNE